MHQSAVRLSCIHRQCSLSGSLRQLDVPKIQSSCTGKEADCLATRIFLQKCASTRRNAASTHGRSRDVLITLPHTRSASESPRFNFDFDDRTGRPIKLLCRVMKMPTVPAHYFDQNLFQAVELTHFLFSASHCEGLVDVSPTNNCSGPTRRSVKTSHRSFAEGNSRSATPERRRRGPRGHPENGSH